MKTLVDVVRTRGAETPDRCAYTFLAEGEERERLTYAQLDARARNLGARLQGAGWAGERAVLLFPPGLDFVAAFFGCLYGGVVAVPAYPPGSRRNLARLLSIVRDARPVAILTTEAALARLQSLNAELPELAELRWIAADQACDAPAGWAPAAPALESTAFLQYTSGSTSEPKGVIVSHRSLIHNEEMIRRAFEQSGESVIVGWLPLYHDMGLIGNVLQPLYVGAHCVLMSPMDFLTRPARWLEAIDRYRATTSGGPSFAYELCVRKIAAEERARLDLASWKVAFNGAEPVRAETLAAFAAAFGPCGFRREAFYPCYGLAEATLFVAGGEVGAAPEVRSFAAAGLERHQVADGDGADARELVACGRAWLGQEIAIVDPEARRRCAPGQVGEIWVAGPSVAEGYWQNEEATERDFRARLAEERQAGPYLRTGDLGFLAGGELFVTGRIKDLIILRGRNHYPQDIERTAERADPALRLGCGAAFAVEVDREERLVIAWELEPHRQRMADAGAVAAAVRRALAEEHEVELRELVLVKAGTIPKTSSGKIRRGPCRERYLRGELAVLGRSGVVEAKPPSEEAAPPALTREAFLAVPPEARRTALEHTLREEVARGARISPAEVPSDEPLLRLGLDSLAAAELKGRIEERLGVAVSLASLLEGIDLARLAGELAAGLAGEPAAGPGLAPGAPLDGDLPLSFGQRALWFLDRLAPASGAYHIVAAARVRPAPDLAALRGGLERLAARHPALRNTFHELRGEPCQRVHAELAPAFFTADAAGWSEAELVARLASEAYRPFDLGAGPLLRVGSFERGDETVLLLAVHHLVADFRSLALLVRELGALYAAGQAGAGVDAPVDPPPALTYIDWVLWRERCLSGSEGERLWRYWRERLSPLPSPLELPTDRPRPPVQSFRGGACALRLPAELGPAAAALARTGGATLFTVLLAAFQTLLHRLSGQDDFAVGSPAAGRGRPELANLVGYFVDPVVLRAELAGEPSFADLLARARRQVAADLTHQGYPFALLAERLQPERGGRPPLFQAMFVLQRAESPEESGLVGFALGLDGARAALGGLTLESLALPEQASQLDLTLRMGEVEGALAASLQHNSDLFDEATAERWLGHWRELLTAAVAEPGRPVSDLPLLSAAERQELLVRWNRTSAAVPRDLCLHQLCAAQAARTPDAVALVAGERRLTYGGLDASADRLAGDLRRLGVGAESRVGVHLGRSEEMIVAMLAVLKAGGAYVPLDPALPAERLALMVADAGIEVVLTRDGLGAALPAGVRELPPSTVGGDLRTEVERIVERPSTGGPPVDPGNLAYVIYTSGSTGRPKGVGIAHRSPVELAFWAREAFTAEELSGVLASTSIGFDLSVFEIFVPLSWGGKVILAENALEPPALAAHGEVTLLNTVPSAMAELASGDLPPGLLAVSLAGEALSPGLVERIYRHRQIGRVVNLYGPTEDTTYSTWVEVPRGAARVTIGMPIANSRAHLLDRRLSPVPLGVAGELYLAGAGLARGYVGRPELTAERFVPDPFGGPGERMYRTGDLARRLPSGEIDFLGRIDRQVKLRGFRIELGEIEAALAACPGVVEAAVVVRERGAGDRSLLACVVAGNPAPSSAVLRGELSRRLPSYMVPGAFAFLPALPLTPNGKVDRKALLGLEPESAAGEEALRIAQTPIEELLAGIFAEVLGVERVGVEEGFFDLGGHSLSAMRLVSRLRESAGVELPVRAVFESPSVVGLSAAVERALGAGGARALLPIEPAPRDRPLPLSFAQQRLWFLDRLEPESAVYNIAAGICIVGSLSAGVLSSALGEVARRHEPLRTRFVEAGGEPAQAIDPPAPVPLPVIDLGGLSAERRELESRRLARAEALRPFDLGAGPLLRAGLLRQGVGEHRLLLTLHHAVADGWSLEVLLRELGSLYGSFARGESSRLPALPIQYVDYAAWQRRWLSEEALAGDLAYWRDRLGGAAALELPADRPRPPVQSFRGGRVAFGIDGALLGELRALARGSGATLFMAVLCGFGSLLSRYGGQEEVSIGTPVAGRTRREMEELIGLFVNTLVLRLDLGGEASFGEVLRRAREVSLGAYAHQDLPFERLVDALAPERSLSMSPLFQAMLAMQRAPSVPSWAASGLELTALRPEEGTAKFDLHLALAEHPEALAGSLEYASDLFERTAAMRLGEHLRRLLARAVAEPGRPVMELPLLSEAEIHQIATEWSDTADEVQEQVLSVCSLFAMQAARHPDRTALSQGEESLSYGELALRSDRLAEQLQEMGVRPEVRVGICAERSLGMLVGLLAILKAGGAYVPLDPGYPSERLAFLFEDSAAAVLLSEKKLAARLPPHGARMVWLDGLGELTGERLSGESVPLNGENLAYVIYTSGSTGKPKGVGIPHRALVNFLTSMSERPGLSDGGTLLSVTTISFDIAVLEIFLPLSQGARMVLASRETAADARQLGELIACSQATAMQATPATWQLLIAGGESGLDRLQAMCGGEALSAGLALALGERVRSLWNLYGPTETTVWSSVEEVRRPLPASGTIPIGRPIASTRMVVLDAAGNPVPVGVAGELYIGGAGLARGYVGRPELTAERFVPDPFGGPGERMYRTGDLARRLPSGEIDFLGRIDRQVKLRGFRVELGEIEAALAGCPGVVEAAVVVRERGTGDRALLACVVAGDPPPSAAALRSELSRRLPSYMVPGAFAFLPALPLTPNGKVDRKALVGLEPDSAADAAALRTPQTQIEELLAGIFAEVLGVERVGLESGFFDLGGHSLSAMRLVSRLRESVGVELPVRAVFELPSVSELAVAVERALGAGGARSLPPIEPAPRDRPLPLSLAQQRLWFLDRLEPGSAVYNIAAGIRIVGDLSAGVLSSALGEVVRRHEPLRTRFVEVDGEPAQAIDPPAPVPLPVVDLGGLSDARRELEFRRLARAEALRPFDLGAGPLLRASFLRQGGGEHRLLLTVHHAVADGWSLEVLLRELGSLYGSLARGEASRLPALPIQYVDYAVWQRRWLTEEALAGDLAYWRDRLRGAAALELPADRPRPPVQSFRGGRVAFGIDGALLGELRALARGSGATLFMAVLGGFGSILSRYAGQEEVSIGTPVAGRTRREMEELIGLFVNTLVLRLDLGGEASFGEVLRRAREVSLGAYAHQDLPFERLVDALAPERSLSMSPLFQAMLAMQRAPLAASWAAAGLSLSALAPEEGTAKFDLHLALAEHPEALAGSLEYASDLFERTAAMRLGEHLGRLLARAVAEPERPVMELPLLSEAEERQLAGWQGASRERPGGFCLHEVFARQASRTAEAVAVVGTGERLRYGELDRRSNRLARHLRRLGVGPEARVGVCLGRSPEMVVALLAVLKAGGAYVPLDAGSPKERLAFMAADARLAALVSEERLAPALPEVGAPLVLLDLDRCWMEEEDGALAPLATPEGLTYVIYTSGSTGRPKGVGIAHRSAVELVFWAREAFGAAELSGVLASTSIGFDLSVFEIFVPLSWGGKVILAENALELSTLPARGEVTLLNTVPSAMAELALGDLPPGLMAVSLAGEALSAGLVERIHRHRQIGRVVNLYGPTEDTTYSTWVEVPRGAARVTIGVPIANTRAHLLDRWLAPVPLGVAGELYLAGAGLARGYVGRPELTAERFVPDPFGGPGERMYRTGDLARRLQGGEIDFLGRIDRQVKLRGFRIELGEIEAALAGHPEVREAAVVLGRGEPRLIGYVVPEREALSAGELRSYLQAKLSAVMVPSVFVWLPALPRTANGKVDHRALTEPAELPSGRERVAPRSELEELLAGIWAQALDLEGEAVSVYDNFFEIGGHSLKAMRVITQIRRELGLELPVRSLFTAPTVAEFAEVVVASLAEEVGDDALFTAIAEVSSAR